MFLETNILAQTKLTLEHAERTVSLQLSAGETNLCLPFWAWVNCNPSSVSLSYARNHTNHPVWRRQIVSISQNVPHDLQGQVSAGSILIHLSDQYQGCYGMPLSNPEAEHNKY